MGHLRHPESVRWRRLCVLCGLGLLLAACTTAEMRISGTPVLSEDYSQRHPLAVESVRAALNLPGAGGQDRLTPTEVRRVDAFVSSYLAEMRGPLMISVPGAAAGDARVLGRAKQIADRARRLGLPPDQVLLRVAAEEERAEAPVVVSYEKLVMRIPECGDWSKEASHDWTNTVHSDFGCSTQRGVGLMIADPADLAKPRTAGLRDAARSNLVIQLYRAGVATVAERAEVERAAITEVSEEVAE